MWPCWPSQEAEAVHDVVKYLIPAGFFHSWPTMYHVSFWLRGLLGHGPTDVTHDMFSDDFDFSEPTLDLIRSYLIHECDLQTIWSDVTDALQCGMGLVKFNIGSYFHVMSPLRGSSCGYLKI